MLFEMLRGEVIQDGWRDPHIKDALDLCLACKGCKGDCPASVDLATYKAEFLSHYYEGRPRPASAYAMGQIFRWAELGSRFPDAANFVAQTPGFRDLAKRMAGVTQHRKLPTFAKTTFKNWFLKHETLTAHRHDTRPVVMLWPDTFNNHFFPHTAQAAVEVLESAGYRVEVPRQRLCCGRPLYDYGFLDQAKQHLRDIIAALQPQINAGTPVVCLEPSCGSVFRDELTNLFPRDEDAHRLRKQTFLLGDFLENVKYQPPALKRKALVHGHCHQKAIFGMTADQKLLKQMGLEAELLDSGCCGLAGSFGYEADHYDVSMKVGERVLLPKVRGAERDTLIVADGFSCREQIMHATPRHALHLAEVIQMALHQPLPSRKARYIEAGFVQEEAAYPAVSAAAGLSVLMASGLYLFAQMQKGNGTGNAPGDTRLTSSTLRGHTE